MKIDTSKVYRLKGIVQHYAWGGYAFIPQLLRIDNTDNRPFAEYWMGAHRAAPSTIETADGPLLLDRILQEQPQLLGKATKEKFGGLPYLLKVLDVREMLSIQVHPTREAANLGFDDEDERGVDINSPKRNYKDRNHKPEVMLALSDFWLLHGFKPEAELRETLAAIPQFRFLVAVFDNAGYEGLYRYVMELPQQEVDAMLIPIVQKEVRRRSFHESERDEAGFWVGEYYLNRAATTIDRGIFSFYFFNLLHLQPGEAVFQAAGLPHAYLFGQNIELMSNSDNVLRGGLTSKHVDIGELIRHIRFEATVPHIMQDNTTGVEHQFHFPVEDFMLASIQLTATQEHSATALSAEIMICVEGACDISADGITRLQAGDAAIMFAGCHYTIKTNDRVRLFRAAVPHAYSQP